MNNREINELINIQFKIKLLSNKNKDYNKKCEKCISSIQKIINKYKEN